MNPVSILDLVFIRHLDYAAAEIEEVMPYGTSKRPALKFKVFDGVIPDVGLLRGVALQHIQELGRPGFSVFLEEGQVVQCLVEAGPKARIFVASP